MSQFSLDDLLLKANLPPEDHKKVQAMLDADARTVAFKRDLPLPRRRTGVHFTRSPTSSSLGSGTSCTSVRCSGFRRTYKYNLKLRPTSSPQRRSSLAAKFHKQAYSGELSLSTAIELAVQCIRDLIPCDVRSLRGGKPTASLSMLVWRPKGRNGSTEISVGLELHYYLKSRSFIGHIEPRQIADPDEAVT